ncbi:MAG: hypothetical protein N3G21_11550, partial [Candidatus Hydrogenedentes bacterium]|nr:hypothetical protein [Candidatus Hydrogenedentota bacterium]
KFLKAVEMMDKRKIYTHGFCMLGFPTETEEELLQTINVASESKLHTATFYTVIPFPGTPLYEWVKENKREIIDKVDYREISFDTARFNLTDIPDHIFFSYNRKAYFKFYANPRRIYRIIRTYPEPLSLLTYIPMFLFKLTKGLLPYHKCV